MCGCKTPLVCTLYSEKKNFLRLKIWSKKKDSKGTSTTTSDRNLQFQAAFSIEFLQFGEGLRGNMIRGKRPERFWEGKLPLRRSLRGSLRGRVSEVSEVFKGCERLLEVFRALDKRFSEVFQSLSETLSECHFPLRVAGRVAPNRVAP